MVLKWQMTRAFFISLIFLIGFGLTAVLIDEHKIKRFDQAVASYIQNGISPAMTSIMKFFTFIGSERAVPLLVLLAAILLYKVFNHRSELLLLLSVVIGSVLLNIILKVLFHRARPTVHRIINATGYSFPSGHSMMAFTLYGILAFLIWKHLATPFSRVIVLIGSAGMILFIGVSRIYLGVHYPSDVLGGYLISGCWLTASIWFYQQFKEKKMSRQ